jgi:aspartate-semialdehyde dehydrogenase
MSICDNIIPYIGSEEQKMETEPLKIMGSLEGKSIRPATFRVSASCHRVPVLDGHTMAIWIDIKESAETVKKAFADFSPPVNGLPSLPEKSILLHDEQDRPQPRLDRNRGGGMTASVGRVRDGIRYVVMGHNTIRGAAGASVLNAELIHKKKYL